MFSGSNRLTIDEKGRLAIPARLRTQLADEYGKTIAITLGPECVVIYPQAVFRSAAETIQKSAHPSKRALMRMFVGNAVECEPDAQGRVMVPAILRDLKALGSDVVLVGQVDHFELWPESQWTASHSEPQISNADAFAALGL
jgi:MraZ protein